MEISALSRQEQEASRRLVTIGIAVLVLGYFSWLIAAGVLPTRAVEQVVEHTLAGGNEHHAAHEDHHPTTPPPAYYSIIPFGILLLCIAILPLFHKTEHWWERNWNRFIVAASLGVITMSYYALLYGHGVVDHGTHELSEPGWPAALVVFKNAILVEYIPFITLLFSLYVISGGICIEGRLAGRPTLNTSIIAIGGLLASFVGTTGAAMLLIRPLLRANAKRDYVAHTVIFFIFVVCNTGGCLLPIGDPPLFLGYLRNVPFTWTLNLWPMWLFVNLALLAVYYVWDRVQYRKEDQAALQANSADNSDRGVRISGVMNFVWLISVIFCVALLDPNKAFPGTDWHAPLYFREIMMMLLAGLSLALTSAEIREKNAFNYDAILEVAALFIGIFICMQAPVQILNVYGPELGFDQPWKFYWGTGILSSFLDNAPTYVVFFETAKTLDAIGPTLAVTDGQINIDYLVAISLGAVFMGAMTYIGNGPNFMVKAIAEKNNIKMPSFFGYMAYSCAVLLPISIVMTLIFL